MFKRIISILIIILFLFGVGYMIVSLIRGNDDIVPTGNNSTTTSTSTNETTVVKLYYYNRVRDIELSGDSENVLCSADAVIPVTRIITGKPTLEDVVNMHIAGLLSDEEKRSGFQTEFPNRDFKLLNAEKKGNEVTLTFNTVPGFTSGGACRVNILGSEVVKTVKEFAGVDRVNVMPEDIFQP